MEVALRYTVILLILICSSPFALSDETWTLAESPVVIASDMTIPAGTTVTIEPGVVVELKNTAKLNVHGSLVGAGTPAEPIVFTGGATSFVYIQVWGTLQLSFAQIDMQVRPAAQGSLLFADTVFGPASGLMNQGIGYFLSLERCTFDDSFIWIGAGTVRMVDTNVMNDFISIGGSILRMDNVSGTGSPQQGMMLYDYEQPVYLDNLSVSSAAGPGIDIIAGNFLFGDNVQLTSNEYPVQLGGAGILPGSVLPAGGNLNNQIKVEFASNGVWSMVWADPGIPYAMTGGQYHTGTLEILPGVTVLLEPNFTLWDDDAVVDARGLPGAPVRFAQLVPGSTWQGLQYFHRFENCIIEGGQAGARFHSGTFPGYIDNCIIRNNDIGMENDAAVRKTRFLDNTVGAWGNDMPLGLESPTNPNSFVGNGDAVQEFSGHIVDARYNWWDDPSGPTSPDNPGGSGQPVTGCCIQTVPFLTAEPDFNDNPPIVHLLASPRRENAGMLYSSFVDPGTAVVIGWDAQDELGITGHRIEFFNGWENAWSLVAELPGDQRSFEWIVPDVGPVNNSSSHRLRVTATDPAGQEGWDEHSYFIPTGVEPGTLTVTGLSAGPFLPGRSIGTLCVEAVGTDPYDMIHWELSFDGDRYHIPMGSTTQAGGGCLPLSPTAPFISSDTARIRLNTSGGQNRVKYFFSDYFTVRPDARLGDAPPSVTLTNPLGGETFPGGGLVPIQWTASDDQGIRGVDIQTSTDGGRTWHFIAEELPPTATSFAWQLPPSAGLSDVRVRVMVSDLHFQTSSDGGAVTFAVSPGNAACTEPPGEVAGLGLDANKWTVFWSAVGGNVTYDVARGELGGLVAGAPAACMSSGATETSYDDFDVPAAGTGYYYLAGATNDCGAGPLGPPEQARASACP